MLGSSFYDINSLFILLDRNLFRIHKFETITELEKYFELKDNRIEVILVNKIENLVLISKTFNLNKMGKDSLKEKEIKWLIFDTPLNLTKLKIKIIDGEQIEDQIIWKPKKIIPVKWNLLLKENISNFDNFLGIEEHEEQTKRPQKDKNLQIPSNPSTVGKKLTLGMKKIF